MQMYWNQDFYVKIKLLLSDESIGFDVIVCEVGLSFILFSTIDTFLSLQASESRWGSWFLKSISPHLGFNSSLYFCVQVFLGFS